MASEPRSGLYLTRTSYREATLHQFDRLENTGYDWRTNVMNRTMSRYFLEDKKRRDILESYRAFIIYIMDYASQIKKSFNYTLDKNYKYYN